jgi:hypothetical protein
VFQFALDEYAFGTLVLASAGTLFGSIGTAAVVSCSVVTGNCLSKFDIIATVLKTICEMVVK